MHISPSLARKCSAFAAWKRTCTSERPAVCLFPGDVYRVSGRRLEAAEHRRAASHLGFSPACGCVRDMICRTDWKWAPSWTTTADVPSRLQGGESGDPHRRSPASQVQSHRGLAEYAKAVQWDDLPVPSVVCLQNQRRQTSHWRRCKPARGMFARWMLHAGQVHR